MRGGKAFPNQNLFLELCSFGLTSCAYLAPQKTDKHSMDCPGPDCKRLVNDDLVTFTTPFLCNLCNISQTATPAPLFAEKLHHIPTGNCHDGTLRVYTRRRAK